MEYTIRSLIAPKGTTTVTANEITLIRQNIGGELNLCIDNNVRFVVGKALKTPDLELKQALADFKLTMSEGDIAKVHEYLINNEPPALVKADDPKFGDQSDEAILTRKVLSEVGPHCTKAEFTIAARTIAGEMNLSQEVAAAAIKLYS